MLEIKILHGAENISSILVRVGVFQFCISERITLFKDPYFIKHFTEKEGYLKPFLRNSR